jgi:hypothetical protein
MPDERQNRETSEISGEDELGQSLGLLPADVSRRVFGSDPQGIARGQSPRAESARAQRNAIVLASLLPVLPYPDKNDAKGTEHIVRFRGRSVEKYQHADGWMPMLDLSGKLTLGHSLPTEYLRRLDLHNELFGDQIRVIGLTQADRFVITQPALRGGEPTENEIRDILKEGGWRRVPMAAQNLPAPLMGSAWWHDEEELVLLDARKPNFKKTKFGVLPIDLIIADLTADMRDLFHLHE